MHFQCQTPAVQSWIEQDIFVHFSLQVPLKIFCPCFPSFGNPFRLLNVWLENAKSTHDVLGQEANRASKKYIFFLTWTTGNLLSDECQC